MQDAAAPATVLLVDDHALVRQGIRLLLATEPSLRLAGEAADAHQALAQVRTLRPHLALVDLGLPDGDGVEVIRRIGAISPETRAIALTASLDRRDVERALAAGARAYVVKQGSGEDLLATIRSVLANFTGIRPALVERAPAPPASSPLTEREREIVELIAGGSQNAEIADVLGVSIFTVRKHRQNLMSKLALRNGAEIAAFAIRHGIFTPKQ